MRGMWSCGHAHMWPCGADHVRSYPREVMTTRGLVGVSRVRTSPPGVKEQFTAVAAAHGLAFGELLERALDAFVREAVVTGHGPLRNAGEFGDAHLSD